MSKVTVFTYSLQVCEGTNTFFTKCGIKLSQKWTRNFLQPVKITHFNPLTPSKRTAGGYSLSTRIQPTTALGHNDITTCICIPQSLFLSSLIPYGIGPMPKHIQTIPKLLSEKWCGDVLGIQLKRGGWGTTTRNLRKLGHTNYQKLGQPNNYGIRSTWSSSFRLT